MKYKIFDAHCDTLCRLCDENASFYENEFNVDKKRMDGYESYTQVFACWVDPIYKDMAMERFIELSDEFYTKNVNGILSIEGGEMITSLKALRTLKRLGVRIAALTWNYSNHIASGVLEENEARGLTEFGKKVIAEMNRINMFVDVSHLNDKSFYDAAEIMKMPIIATHSNSRAICPHKRNLTDDQFKIIVKSGGCTGINFYNEFLDGDNSDIDSIVKHIEHFMSLGGEDCIGIGADYDGVDDELPKGISGCQDTYKLFDRLLSLNYTEEQVEKISHRNFERLFGGNKNA